MENGSSHWFEIRIPSVRKILENISENEKVIICLVPSVLQRSRESFLFVIYYVILQTPTTHMYLVKHYHQLACYQNSFWNFWNFCNNSNSFITGFNPLQPVVAYLYPLKTSENLGNTDKQHRAVMVKHSFVFFVFFRGGKEQGVVLLTLNRFTILRCCFYYWDGRAILNFVS